MLKSLYPEKTPQAAYETAPPPTKLARNSETPHKHSFIYIQGGPDLVLKDFL